MNRDAATELKTDDLHLHLDKQEKKVLDQESNRLVLKPQRTFVMHSAQGAARGTGVVMVNDERLVPTYLPQGSAYVKLRSDTDTYPHGCGSDTWRPPPMVGVKRTKSMRQMSSVSRIPGPCTLTELVSSIDLGVSGASGPPN